MCDTTFLPNLNEPLPVSQPIPAYVKLNNVPIPSEFLSFMVKRQTIWVENQICFRMQPNLPRVIRPCAKMYITTMEGQVWNSFKTILLSNVKVNVASKNGYVKDHGKRSHQYKIETLEFGTNGTTVTKIPSLANENWHVKVWKPPLGKAAVAKLYFLRFTYNFYNHRVRVDFKYSCYSPERIGKYAFWKQS